ncbi:ParB/RepB/Spo0J family partition protein [Patescibacteria group bacterium]|nr:ParB/RepB/Spo0J family partition protein [Patescibacteria group bacterium]
MAKPFKLGKGLNSLIPQKKSGSTNYWGNEATPQPPEVAASGGGGERVHYLNPKEIAANSRQPRQNFNAEDLADLVASVKTHGILQPLTVSQLPSGKYELIAGERRLRAAVTAGLKQVPAILRQVKDQERLELALVENIQRQNLNPLEEAVAYKQLQEEFSLTQEQIAQRVGKSRPQIANTLRLLDLPDSIKQALSEGKITFGHAKVIMSLDTPFEQEKFFRLITLEGLPVRLAEAKVHSLKANKTAVVPTTSVQLKAWQQQLQNILGTKVKISGSLNKGKIILEFYSSEDLMGLVEKIKKAGE